METFQCEPFGTVTVKRRHGAKNIRIRIEADSIMVSADFYSTKKQIAKLLDDNLTAILEKQEALKASRKLIDDSFSVSCSFFSLRVYRDERIKKLLYTIRCESTSIPYRFALRCNDSISFGDSSTQKSLLGGINKTIRNVAGPILERRTMQLAQELGFQVNSVKVKIEKTKWGSCSTLRNINLSAYLILLPEDVRDFVIIHELCHLKEMNHSHRFHELVNRYTGGRESELDKRLKKYSNNIFDYAAKQ